MFEDETLTELKGFAEKTKDFGILRELLIEINDRILIEKSEGSLSTLMDLRQKAAENLEKNEDKIFENFFDEEKLRKYAFSIDEGVDAILKQYTKGDIIDNLLDVADKNAIISRLVEMYSEKLELLFDKLSEYMDLTTKPEWEC